MNTEQLSTGANRGNGGLVQNGHIGDRDLPGSSLLPLLSPVQNSFRTEVQLTAPLLTPAELTAASRRLKCFHDLPASDQVERLRAALPRFIDLIVRSDCYKAIARLVVGPEW